VARLKGPATFRVTDNPFDFEDGGAQSFRWESMQDFDLQQLTFATDREAAHALKEAHEISGWATGHH